MKRSVHGWERLTNNSNISLYSVHCQQLPATDGRKSESAPWTARTNGCVRLSKNKIEYRKKYAIVCRSTQPCTERFIHHNIYIVKIERTIQTILRISQSHIKG